jgi:predicted RNase H-like nuclease (RuvC/YqgF family)
MNLKKPDRSVSEMDVLKDIRGLLSITQERENDKVDGASGEGGLENETANLEAQIKYYKKLVQNLRQELNRVEKEKEELAAKLKMLGIVKDNPTSPVLKSTLLGEEAAQIEARITELSSTLSQIDGLLKLRVQELLKKIARLFQEAGQGDTAVEFRKAANELENVENFAHFLRVLID